MAPRVCFLDVAKSSDWDLFNGALVVKKASWTSLDSSRIILDHFCDFRIFPKFCHFGFHFHHILIRGNGQISSSQNKTLIILHVGWISESTYYSFWSCALRAENEPVQNSKLQMSTEPSIFTTSTPTIKESASHHIKIEIHATPKGQSLWILCASTRNLWIWDNFCGLLWLRGGVFWTSPSLQIGTFLMELWWSRKLPEPPWIHLRSSWIISVIFEIFPNFVILDFIFTTFWSGAMAKSHQFKIKH